jgi:hypothetical protein
MLKCWRVLIPLKMDDGFDSAISSPEQVCWRPEQIELKTIAKNSYCFHLVEIFFKIEN